MSICASCRRSLLARISRPSLTQPPSLQQLTLRRTVTGAATAPSSSPGAAPSTPPPATTTPDGSSPPPATSTSPPSASQPFSTPGNTPPADLVRGKQPPGLTKTRSSCPGGTTLKGLVYIKGAPAIVAKEDDEYPEWLWTILSSGKGNDDAMTKAGLSEMTKKQRHKYERKQEKLRASLPKKIPLHEQSIDLTPADATAEQSLAARQELTKSQRDARRKGIRERNFLGSM